MRIAVIGSGRIGGTLGRAFAAAGHQVKFGSRRGVEDGAGGTPSTVTGVTEALVDAEVVVLAVPGSAVAALVAEEADALSGKLIVDATNNVGGGGPANSHDAVLAAVPAARYARAFNSLGVENLVNPHFGDVVADMFFSASVADAPTVSELIEAVGLRPAYVGEGAHDVVDGALRLWFALARIRGRHLGFRVLDDGDA